MGVQKTEVEAPSTVSAEKMYQGFLLDMDTVFPKVLPQLIKSVEILEGDGGVGTVTPSDSSILAKVYNHISAPHFNSIVCKFHIYEKRIFYGVPKGTQ